MWVNSYLRANWKLAEVLAEAFLGLSEGLLPAEEKKKAVTSLKTKLSEAERNYVYNYLCVESFHRQSPYFERSI